MPKKQTISLRVTSFFMSVVTIGMLASVPLRLARAQQDEEPDWIVPEEEAAKKNPVAPNAQSIAAGKLLYAQQCVSCHGATGKGDGPLADSLEKRVPDFTADAKIWEQSDGALFWKISEGNGYMPGFRDRFTEEQRWQVVNYIRTFAPKPQHKATKVTGKKSNAAH